jgi:hypothetical protein
LLRRPEGVRGPARYGTYLRPGVLWPLFAAEGITGYRACAEALGLTSQSVLHRYAGPNPIPVTTPFSDAVRRRFRGISYEDLFVSYWEESSNDQHATARRAA